MIAFLFLKAIQSILEMEFNPMFSRSISRSGLCVTAAMLFLGASFSQAHADPKKPTFEVGGGVAGLSKSDSMDLLMKVEYSGKDLERNPYLGFVLGRLTFSGAGGIQGDHAGAIEYADLEFEAMRMQSQTSDGKYSFSLVTGDVIYKRNYPVGNGEMLMVTVISTRSHLGLDLTDHVKAYVDGAADILGLGFAKGLQDGVLSNGAGMRLKLEGGLLFGSRFRISAGFEEMFISSRKPSESCRPNPTESDPSGAESSICSFNSGKGGQTTRENFEKYARAVLQINDSLSAFGEVRTVIYELTSKTHPGQNHKDSAEQYFIGLMGKF